MVCLVNRCMRDPHVQWCERLSPSPTGDGTDYPIVRSLFFFSRFRLSIEVCRCA